VITEVIEHPVMLFIKAFAQFKDHFCYELFSVHFKSLFVDVFLTYLSMVYFTCFTN
jgi:hypothetical protein